MAERTPLRSLSSANRTASIRRGPSPGKRERTSEGESTNCPIYRHRNQASRPPIADRGTWMQTSFMNPYKVGDKSSMSAAESQRLQKAWRRRKNCSEIGKLRSGKIPYHRDPTGKTKAAFI